MKPTLGKLYPLKDFSAEWMRAFGSTPQQFALPTEFVLWQAQVAIPMMARAYHTSWYAYRGCVVTHSWLIHLCEVLGRRFEGTSRLAERVVVVEVWDNHGDDGHVENHLVGFRFVPEGALTILQYNWHTGNPVGPPEAMKWQPFDEEDK
jgi:hypothetical protein